MSELFTDVIYLSRRRTREGARADKDIRKYGHIHLAATGECIKRRHGRQCEPAIVIRTIEGKGMAPLEPERHERQVALLAAAGISVPSLH